MANDKFELTRRKALAGLGTIGAASAGAGLGTTAYLNDTEDFTGNDLSAGTLDLLVDWYTSYDQGDFGSGSDSGTVNGNPNDYSYKISDVKPGDSGKLGFCPSIDGNPGYVQVAATSFTQGEGDIPEPEDSLSGDSDDDTDGTTGGDLAENVDVEVYYANSVEISNDEVTCTKIDADTDDGQSDIDPIFSGTLLELYNNVLKDGALLDGNLNSGFDNGDAYVASDDTNAGSDGYNPCLCIEWSIDTSVGNIIQDDSVSLDFQFEAVQERHNDSATFPS